MRLPSSRQSAKNFNHRCKRLDTTYCKTAQLNLKWISTVISRWCDCSNKKRPTWFQHLQASYELSGLQEVEAAPVRLNRSKRSLPSQAVLFSCLQNDYTSVAREHLWHPATTALSYQFLGGSIKETMIMIWFSTFKLMKPLLIRLKCGSQLKGCNIKDKCICLYFSVASFPSFRKRLDAKND